MIAIYVGKEFPEYIGTEVEVFDTVDSSGFPCYAMILGRETIDNMGDEDFKFIE